MSRTCASPASRGAAILVLWVLAAAPPAQGGWAPEGVRVASAYADRAFPVAAPDGEGGAFVAWQESARIRLQRLTAEGVPAPGWSASHGREVCAPSGYGGYEQSSPRAIPDGAGGVYVLWHDERETGCRSSCLGEPKQIYVQRFGPGGDVAEGWPALGRSVGSWLSRMSPTPGGTRGYPGEMNTVLAPDGRGGLLVAWLEQSLRGNVEPGLRVQRVGPRGDLLWGERGAFDLAISLPGPGPATLELFDVAGRRVAAREVGALGMGRHRARIGDGERLAPGVYVIRLTHGGRKVATRGVISP